MLRLSTWTGPVLTYLPDRVLPKGVRTHEPTGKKLSRAALVTAEFGLTDVTAITVSGSFRPGASGKVNSWCYQYTPQVRDEKTGEWSNAAPAQKSNGGTAFTDVAGIAKQEAMWSADEKALAGKSMFRVEAAETEYPTELGELVLTIAFTRDAASGIAAAR